MHEQMLWSLQKHAIVCGKHEKRNDRTGLTLLQPFFAAPPCAPVAACPPLLGVSSSPALPRALSGAAFAALPAACLPLSDAEQGPVPSLQPLRLLLPALEPCWQQPVPPQSYGLWQPAAAADGCPALERSRRGPFHED